MIRPAIPLITLLVCLGGCAPARFVDGVPWAIRQTHVTNARARFVHKRPYLRLNTFLLHQLVVVERTEELAAARDRLLQTVDESRALAQEILDNEIDRLSEESITGLLDRYFHERSERETPRKALRTRFFRVVSHDFIQYRRRVAGLAELGDVQKEARALRRVAGKSPKDRHGRGPLLALVALSIGVERGLLDRGGPMVDVYFPSASSLSQYGEDSTKRLQEDEWLAKFAPVIVQERIEQETYEPDTDLIGTVRLDCVGRTQRVVVDASSPSLYAYWRHTLINDERRCQLTYTYWFPRHPKLKRADTEAGEIEGATLRITLDGEGLPILFETVMNCGCYHRCYPSDALEASACEAFGGPLKDKSFCVERNVAGRIDWVVAEVVVLATGSGVRPVIFSRAGYHGPASVAFCEESFADRTILERKPYDLRPYDELERLPTPDGYGSMFLDNGLVRGAERLEGILLSVTGMLNAGQPRQRGTQLLHWDQYDFDDPLLLEKCLRLPAGL